MKDKKDKLEDMTFIVRGEGDAEEFFAGQSQSDSWFSDTKMMGFSSREAATQACKRLTDQGFTDLKLVSYADIERRYD